MLPKKEFKKTKIFSYSIQAETISNAPQPNNHQTLPIIEFNNENIIIRCYEENLKTIEDAIKSRLMLMAFVQAKKIELSDFFKIIDGWGFLVIFLHKVAYSRNAQSNIDEINNYYQEISKYVGMPTIPIALESHADSKKETKIIQTPSLRLACHQQLQIIRSFIDNENFTPNNEISELYIKEISNSHKIILYVEIIKHQIDEWISKNKVHNKIQHAAWFFLFISTIAFSASLLLKENQSTTEQIFISSESLFISFCAALTASMTAFAMAHIFRFSIPQKIELIKVHSQRRKSEEVRTLVLKENFEVQNGINSKDASLPGSYISPTLIEQINTGLNIKEIVKNVDSVYFQHINDKSEIIENFENGKKANAKKFQSFGLGIAGLFVVIEIGKFIQDHRDLKKGEDQKAFMAKIASAKIEDKNQENKEQTTQETIKQIQEDFNKNDLESSFEILIVFFALIISFIIKKWSSKE